MTIIHGKRRLLSVASILLTAAGAVSVDAAPARAQVVVFGGGAAGASLSLRGMFNCYGLPLTVDGLQNEACTTPFGRNRLFLYAPRGSSAGINTWLRDDPTRIGFPSAAVPIAIETSVPADNGVTAWEQVTIPGTPIYPPTLGAFSSVEPIGYPQHHFSVSNSIVPQTDLVGINDRSFDCFDGEPGADPSCRYGNFDSDPALDPTIDKTGPAFQVPITVSTIVFPFHTTGAGSGSLRLSRVAYCGIWQGTINFWDHPAILVDNPFFNPPLGQPIIRFVRQDGSGTTFLLANALEASCDGAGGRANWTGGTGEMVTWPATNFYFAPGNESVGAAVASTLWSIGYTTAEVARPAVTSLTIPRTFVINDADPATPPITINATPSITARQRASLQNNASSPTFVFPSPSTATLAMTGKLPPAGADRLDGAKWGQQGFNPFPTTDGSYPIVGFTWYLGYTCYADGGVARALRGFWGAFTAGNPLSTVTGGNELNRIVDTLQQGKMPREWRMAVREHMAQNPATRIGGVLEPTTTGNPICAGRIGA